MLTILCYLHRRSKYCLSLFLIQYALFRSKLMTRSHATLFSNTKIKVVSDVKIYHQIPEAISECKYLGVFLLMIYDAQKMWIEQNWFSSNSSVHFIIFFFLYRSEITKTFFILHTLSFNGGETWFMKLHTKDFNKTWIAFYKAIKRMCNKRLNTWKGSIYQFISFYLQKR